MNIETKLQRFSDVVHKEAEMLKEQQESELNEKYNAAVSEFEKKANSKYKEMAEEAEILAEREMQKEIAKKNAEVKKCLIQDRAKYTDEVFKNVTKKLNSFFEKPEYEKLIVDSINSYKSNDSDITAYIMERDIKLRNSIAEKTGVSVIAVDEDFLGGVKISIGKNKIADCTLKHKFESERSSFNKIRIM